MGKAVDQTARDLAMKSAHKAELSEQAIRMHMQACETNHAEDGKRFDKLEQGLGRIHGRIDALVRGGMIFCVTTLVGVAIGVIGWLATRVAG